MEKTKEILKDLCSMVSVSGYEHRSAKALAEKYGGYFDNSYVDKFGNCVFVKKSEKENAPKLLVDAHFDEVAHLARRNADGSFAGFWGARWVWLFRQSRKTDFCIFREWEGLIQEFFLPPR